MTRKLTHLEQELRLAALYDEERHQSAQGWRRESHRLNAPLVERMVSAPGTRGRADLVHAPAEQIRQDLKRFSVDLSDHDLRAVPITVDCAPRARYAACVEPVHG